MAEERATLHRLDAVTLATRDMARALKFYAALGFALRKGGPDKDFSSLDAGSVKLNLILVAQEAPWPWWGRLIFHTPDVDAMYQRVRERGLSPHAPPRDADWGERFFHLTDPDGHELSFARPL